MNTFTIEIPDSVKAFVDEEIAAGRIASPSELFQKLVLDERKRKARTQLKKWRLRL